MNAMGETKAMRHALRARLLIEQCGGGLLAQEACRVSDSQLSRYADPNHPDFMPADVIADLEAMCGKAIYSQFLLEQAPSTASAASVLEEACDTVQAASDLLGVVRRATADRQLSRNELLTIERAAHRLSDELLQFKSAVAERMDSAGPRAVSS